MQNTLLVAILAIAILIILYLLATRGKLSQSEQTKQKEENKQKILALFETTHTITNNDAETLLGVSDATATRYLHELKEEGTIEQVGTTGRGVEYRLK